MQCCQETEGRRKYVTSEAHIFLRTRAPSAALTSRTTQSNSLSRRRAASSLPKVSLYAHQLPLLQAARNNLPIKLDLDHESEGTKKSNLTIPTLKQCLCQLPSLRRSLHSLKDIFQSGNILWRACKIKLLNQLATLIPISYHCLNIPRP